MTNFLTYSLPEGVHLQTLSDQSIFIKNSVDEVKSTAIMGGILAILVLFLFLRQLGPTVIIGLAIPISIIATFAPMKIFDVSLNIMSLGGLALGIGMLVDNSIVVLESIARCREDGDGLIPATLRGVSEVGGAVIASTLTTIAVFFPIVFVQGVAGQVFGDMAMTVVFSLLASLLVALFLIPMLSSRQMSAFTGTVDMKAIPQKFILNTPLKEQIDALFIAGERSFFAKTPAYFLTFFGIFTGWAWRSALVLGAVALSLIKDTILAVLVFLQPLGGLFSLFSKFNYGGRIISFSENGHQNIKFVQRIWPEYLRFKSVGDLYRNCAQIKQRITTDRWLKTTVRSPWMFLQFIFYIFQYLIQLVIEMLFRFSHAFILLLSLFGYLLVFVLRMIFTAPMRLIVVIFDWNLKALERHYPIWLKKALDNKFAVVGSVTLLFLFTIFVIWPRLGSELIPEVHQGEFYLELQLPVGTPVEKTDQRILPIEQQLLQIPGIAQVASVSGTDKSATSDSDEGEHTARLTITLKPTSDLAATEEQASKEVRKVMQDYSGIAYTISRPVLFSSKTPVEVYLKGYNLADLQKYSWLLEERMKEIPGLVDVKSNIQRGNPEVQIYYNRKILAHHGLNIRNVASIVRNKVRGDVATEFKEADRRIDLLVRLRERDKKSINSLRQLVINPGNKIPITLQSVAEIRINEGPSQIRRIGQQRSAVITANLAEGYDLSSANTAIFGQIEQINLPSDFSYEIAGQNKEMETSLTSLMLALTLAIFLVYIVMASQFESLVHPLIIIFTIPLAIIGVVIFLYLLNIPLSIVVFLGMIMLAGIVVNNAIVLVDYINHLRRKGMPKLEAVMEAGKVRLRPIMMTTTTTVLGLLPMALGLGDGAEIRTPMAITVIIGLIVSTMLTLVVIPTVYVMFTREKVKESSVANG